MFKFAFPWDNMPYNPCRDAFCVEVFMKTA